ncbi:hypothetical protein [Salipiger sp.]|uniref:hypothetical protein n=1 Tax=Salipiger sp. TaxID=2078585 RepID=UPI003A983B5A
MKAKHRKLAQGYTTRMNRNGTLEHTPIRRIPFLTPRGLLLTLVGFVVFKAIVLANLGPEEYAVRISHLANGTIAEKVGAWMMGLDPATAFLVQYLQPVLS